jgi:Pyruvate/2-oxoacid:ferredoxin oxidoreductase delta subunit
MNWETQALKIIEAIPLPPIMSHLAKMDAKRRAWQKGLNTVTIAIAHETKKGYEQIFGEEATALIKAMSHGEDVDLPEEFFEEDPDELYSVQLCPAKFGACTRDKREMMRQIITPIRDKLRQLGTTRIMMDKARSPLMSHHILRISIIGCPNCCLPPYFSDFGIICVYRPGLNSTGCIQCKACVNYCSEEAITLENDSPVIDHHKCLMCGGCEKICPEGVIFIQQAGYKVVIGGSGSRHPQIAQTVTENTDIKGVLHILDNALKVFQGIPEYKKEIAFHEMIQTYGIDRFKR